MAAAPLTDDELLEALRLYTEYGNVSEAARHARNGAGMPRPSFSHRLQEARRKFQSGAALKTDIDTRIAEGFQPKAYSHLTRTETGELIWLKADAKKEDALNALRGAVAAILEPSVGVLPPVAAPTGCDADLLTVIPMGDPHFGMLAWAEEVGENFDLSIAERVTFDAVDRLAAAGPSSETALLLNLGDFFHADNSSNRTPRSGANLDVDGRFDKIARVGVMAMVRCVRRLLEKHAHVIVRNNRGNHDPHQASMLTLALQGWFHKEPRVTIEATASSFYYHRFGNTLIGSTHGDGAKLNDLPLIMATDAPAEWAAAKFRVWHCGHFHHDQLKEHPGCTVETHRTLAAGDAWHRHSGYRSGRDMKAIIYHRVHGEVTRIRCGLSMITEEAA